MKFDYSYKHLINTISDIELTFNSKCYVQNEILTNVEVDFENSHPVLNIYGNTGKQLVSMPIKCLNSVGHTFRILLDFYDKLEMDKTTSLSELIGTPIRIVYDDVTPTYANIIAIGHFLENRFIYLDELTSFKD